MSNHNTPNSGIKSVQSSSAPAYPNPVYFNNKDTSSYYHQRGNEDLHNKGRTDGTLYDYSNSPLRTNNYNSPSSQSRYSGTESLNRSAIRRVPQYSDVPEYGSYNAYLPDNLAKSRDISSPQQVTSPQQITSPHYNEDSLRNTHR